MKKSMILAGAMLLSAFGATAQVSENFNGAASRNDFTSACWTFWGMDLRTSGSESINGSNFVRSSQLSGNTATLKTPFIGMNGATTLTFSHKMSANNGITRSLKVYLEDVNGNQFGADLYNWDYIAQGGLTTVRNANVAVNATGDYMIVFEFAGTGGNSRGVMDDLSLSAGSISADPGNNCQPVQACPDTDNDGVCDGDDEYPNDPNKAYRGTPTVATYGFEDLWPAAGDYDFNDAVTWWESFFVNNANNQVVGIEFNSVTRAVGAGFNNGFALHIPTVSPSEVASVSGNVLNGNLATMNANGTEAGQTNAVVFIYESAEDVINRAGGAYFNTRTGDPMGTSDTVKVVIDFNTTKAFPFFDPFMVVNQDRGREVHRVDWAPTDLANNALFGTANDDSDAGSNRYYVTEDNFPWVVRIPNGFAFDYPVEKVDIVQAHLKFADWVQSSGVNFTDWYEDKPGYRNAANIY